LRLVGDNAADYKGNLCRRISARSGQVLRLSAFATESRRSAQVGATPHEARLPTASAMPATGFASQHTKHGGNECI
jgi:hypothetical protein